jgi:hypothetical protein
MTKKKKVNKHDMDEFLSTCYQINADQDELLEAIEEHTSFDVNEPQACMDLAYKLLVDINQLDSIRDQLSAQLHRVDK